MERAKWEGRGMKRKEEMERGRQAFKPSLTTSLWEFHKEIHVSVYCRANEISKLLWVFSREAVIARGGEGPKGAQRGRSKGCRTG